MARSAGISGVGVAAATAGALLMYAGIRDVPVLDALREITGGKLPEGNRSREGTPGSAASAARAVLDSTPAPSGGGAGVAQVAAGGDGFPELAKAALRYKGRPYQWGAVGPDTFDCSGLVMRAFADIGITAPRTTYQQQPWRALTRIAPTQMAAGDLVFWPGHVAIVVAPGTVVHAPGTGRVVSVVPVGQAGPRGTSPVFKRYTGARTKPKAAAT